MVYLYRVIIRQWMLLNILLVGEFFVSIQPCAFNLDIRIYLLGKMTDFSTINTGCW